MGPTRLHLQGAGARLPLKRLGEDAGFWTKIAALWHRERARAEYLVSGYPAHEARLKASAEALEVARAHGYRGDLKRLKADLAELLVTELPALRRASGGRPRTWEEATHVAMLELLAMPGATSRAQLQAFLRAEAVGAGRFAGQVGLYKLLFIFGYVPTMEHLEQRNAFLSALTDFGRDWDACDPNLYRMVLRFSRQYTLRPFETRLGFSMPGRIGTRATSGAPRTRNWLGRQRQPRADSSV